MYEKENIPYSFHFARGYAMGRNQADDTIVDPEAFALAYIAQSKSLREFWEEYIHFKVIHEEEYTYSNMTTHEKVLNYLLMHSSPIRSMVEGFNKYHVEVNNNVFEITAKPLGLGKYEVRNVK